MDSTLPNDEFGQTVFTNISSATSGYVQTSSPGAVPSYPSLPVKQEITLQLSAEHAIKMQGIIDAIESMEEASVSTQDILKSAHRSLDDIPASLMDLQKTLEKLNPVNHITVHTPEAPASHVTNTIQLSIPKPILWYILITQTIIMAAVAGWILLIFKSQVG